MSLGFKRDSYYLKFCQSQNSDCGKRQEAEIPDNKWDWTKCVQKKNRFISIIHSKELELISKIAGFVMDLFLIQASFLLGFYVAKGLMLAFSAP